MFSFIFWTFFLNQHKLEQFFLLTGNKWKSLPWIDYVKEKYGGDSPIHYISTTRKNLRDPSVLGGRYEKFWLDSQGTLDRN